MTTYPNHPGYSRLGGRTGYSLIHAVIFALVCFFGLVWCPPPRPSLRSSPPPF